MATTSQYILEKKIARGGMAEIWLCRQIGGDGFQRICAVKRILPHYAEDTEYVQMFRDEAEIGKSLRHANIVRVEGFQAFGPTWGIIMEFVEGSDLRALLHHCVTNKMRLTVPLALHVIAEAAKGLHYAHMKPEERTGKHFGIIHRDVSPQNILVSFAGEVKVTDFGIANARIRMTDTKSGIVKGKYSYMSPEQVAVKPIDARSDIFSLGIVLWECLTMTRLFNQSTDVETIRSVHECRIPPTLREHNRDVDAELEAVVLRALQRDVNRRYQSASEFEREIRRYLSRRYPDFTSEDVARFLGNALQKKKKDVSDDIRNLLSQDIPSQNQLNKVPSQPSWSFAPQQYNQRSNHPSNYSSNPSASFRYSSSQSSYRTTQTFNKRLPSQHSRHGQIRGQFSRGPLFSPALLATLVVLGALTGMFMLGKLPGRLAAKSPVQVLATGNVPSAKFAINGHNYDAGRFRKMPLGLKLEPGKYLIQASRPGYYSASAQITIGPEDYLKEVPLQFRQKSKLTQIKVTAKWASGPVVIVNVDSGFQVIKIPSSIDGTSQTAEIGDLQHGAEYSVVASVAENGQKRNTSCRFIPPVTNAGQEAVLQIDFIEKKCTLFVKSI